MPIYPYRCPRKHYSEKFFPMGSQEKEINCACGLIAKRVYTVPQISVDNMDKVDMSISTGRNFSNKREFESWLKANNSHVLDDSEWAADREWLAEKTEISRELRAKGIDPAAYAREQKIQAQAAQDSRLKDLGVSFEQISESEYSKQSAEGQWVDTVESDYCDSSNRMSIPKERVACPYSELTNGAVSNV